MRPRFHPRLINGPFEDPGLIIPFLYENRAILFDSGDLNSLSSREILKISHVFITHTHMDHFIGFDRLLRLFLGREKKLCMYGPPGFLQNAEGKLAGYTWNLVENYQYSLSLQLTEVHKDHCITKTYRGRDKFSAGQKAAKHSFKEKLHAEAGFKVFGVLLDHSLPCLAFSIHERFHVNIIKSKLESLGLETGSWLNQFKQALYRKSDPSSQFEVVIPEKGFRKSFPLGDLAEQIALITPGQKITYITDVVYSDSNNEKIAAFAKNSDHLFIEAVFLDKDRDMAKQKYHLTARQAGELASKAGAKQFTIFHFSPRYLGQENLLYQEAADAYNQLI
jgi:ribonuclease Z